MDVTLLGNRCLDSKFCRQAIRYFIDSWHVRSLYSEKQPYSRLWFRQGWQQRANRDILDSDLRLVGALRWPDRSPRGCACINHIYCWQQIPK